MTAFSPSGLVDSGRAPESHSFTGTLLVLSRKFDIQFLFNYLGALTRVRFARVLMYFGRVLMRFKARSGSPDPGKVRETRAGRTAVQSFP